MNIIHDPSLVKQQSTAAAQAKAEPPMACTNEQRILDREKKTGATLFAHPEPVISNLKGLFYESAWSAEIATLIFIGYAQ